jgi:N-acetylglucosamine-6-phosphate deacetylase
MSFFDLQVNGYSGVDFNGDDLDAEAFEGACAALGEDGVGGILATVITDEVEAMCRRLERIAAIREESAVVREMVEGVHIEGPFINGAPGYVGAHPVSAVRPAEPGVMERLLEAAGGLTKIVTLAPEKDDGFAVTRHLADRGICVSAGHCDPSKEDLRGAIDAGLKMFTHLGNGCPMEMHRHDNVVQRALSLREDLWLCFIPDGWHVPFAALGNYVALAGVERCIFVTDAISAARLGPGTYGIGDQRIEIGEDGIAWAAGGKNFAGSTVTMPQILENIRGELNMSDVDAERLVSTNPRAALGMEEG